MKPKKNNKINKQQANYDPLTAFKTKEKEYHKRRYIFGRTTP